MAAHPHQEFPGVTLPTGNWYPVCLPSTETFHIPNLEHTASPFNLVGVEVTVDYSFPDFRSLLPVLCSSF